MYQNTSYTSVPIGILPSEYDNAKRYRRKSCWRAWNALSSLQRSLILIVVFLGAVTLIYVVPNAYRDAQNGYQDKTAEKSEHGNAVMDHWKRLQGELINMPKKTHDHHLTGSVDKPVAKIEDNPDLVKQDLPIKERPVVLNPVQHLTTLQKPGADAGTQRDRQQAVVAAMQHAWSAYRKYAWGKDTLRPVSRTHETWFNLGLTIIDSLDTLYIMGLQDEFTEARNWVANMTIAVNRDVNLFECTIRVLGGLLSAHHLSHDQVFLTKAVELGDRLLPAFKSGSPIPYSDVNLFSGHAHAPVWGPDSSTSEVTTLQLEFRELSLVTGDQRFAAEVNDVTNHVHGQPKFDGLVPMFINAQTGTFRGAVYTLGARADSYYEYLLKMWLQSKKTDEQCRRDFLDAVDGITKHLVKFSEPNKLLYIGEVHGSRFSPKMDHLVCFMAGSLALAAANNISGERDSTLFDLGRQLGHTCWKMYDSQPTKLSPEIVYFNMQPAESEDITVKPADAHNLLRPETVESLFYLYRLTGDIQYRDQGWEIFQAFEKYTKLPEGYSTIGNVRNPENPGYRDKMESFFMAETLKYLYLLFDDSNAIPLDKWVFNTEGHPLPIR